MPRSGYLIFANSGAADQFSGLISLFDVIEVYPVVQAIQIPENIRMAVYRRPNRIAACWMREDGDTETHFFQGQIAILNPDGSTYLSADYPDFAFTQPFNRWVNDIFLFGFAQLGVHTIEARLRRAGEQEWRWVQSVPFLVQVVHQIIPPAIPPIENPPV
jgi:hypothetical protein